MSYTHTMILKIYFIETLPYFLTKFSYHTNFHSANPIIIYSNKYTSLLMISLF